MRGLGAVLLVLGLPGTALAADYASCRTSPNLVGACFSVHGRLFAANGAPSVRIGLTGSNRILGVLDRQLRAESDEVTPKAVGDLLAADPFFTDVYGDYVVCPFEKDTTGAMRAVCIEDAAHLVAQKRR